MTWKVEVVEGYASDLAQYINGLVAAGAEMRFVLPNGVNRWTVIWTMPPA